MSEKLLYIDTETSGLDEKICEPHQIAVIIEINGKIFHKEIFYAHPINWETINPEALSISRISIDKLKTYPSARTTYAKFKHLLKQYVNPYDREDKFIAVGYNVGFDITMLNAWYKKLGDNFFFATVDSKKFRDVLEYIKFFTRLGILEPMENSKLTTVCENLCLDIKEAHDAMCDIIATRALYWRCNKILDLLKEFVQSRNTENNITGIMKTETPYEKI